MIPLFSTACGPSKRQLATALWTDETRFAGRCRGKGVNGENEDVGSTNGDNLRDEAVKVRHYAYLAQVAEQQFRKLQVEIS